MSAARMLACARRWLCVSLSKTTQRSTRFSRDAGRRELDGDPVISPLPRDGTARLRAEISGRVKANGLLAGNQEAEALACGSLVAGARSERSASMSVPYSFEIRR